VAPLLGVRFGVAAGEGDKLRPRDPPTRLQTVGFRSVSRHLVTGLADQEGPVAKRSAFPRLIAEPRRQIDRRRTRGAGPNDMVPPRLIAGLPPGIAAGRTPRPAGPIQIFRKLPRRTREVGLGFPGLLPILGDPTPLPPIFWKPATNTREVGLGF
jgi:hypothetical protein